MTFAAFSAFTSLAETVPPGDLTERQKGYFDAFQEYFQRPQLRAPGALIKPSDVVYTGKLMVLTDGDCASACEDFVMPLKYSGRATILGARTYGSSGQPWIHDFGNGMRIRISSLRLYLPDGSEFEGVGIRPDVEVEATADELRSGRDVVLERGDRHEWGYTEPMPVVGAFDRITVEAGKCGGKPCIRGMRITVRRVLELLASHPDRASVLTEYPFLETEDLNQALSVRRGGR